MNPQVFGIEHLIYIMASLLIAFLICVLNYSNPFYMKGPALEGTIFTVWVIAPIYIIVYILILLSVEVYRKIKSK